MRSLDQNVRQRQSQAIRHEEKSQRHNLAPISWEHRHDEGYESTNSGSNVPMYNPLHISDDTNGTPGSSPPGSFSLSSYDKDNMLRLPGKMEVLHSTGGKLHPHSLALSSVPDSSYQAYLKGQSIKKKTSFIDGICFAKFCAFFSTVAIMFFIFVGIIIDVQPMYIQGILIKNEQYNENQKMQTFYDLTQAERIDTARHAYQAAFFYFLTVCACLAYAYNFHFWFISRMRQYHDIPDADTANFVIPQERGSLPMFNSAAYQHDNSMGSRIWNVTTMRIASIWPSYREKRRSRRRQMGAKDV